MLSKLFALGQDVRVSVQSLNNCSRISKSSIPRNSLTGDGVCART